MAVVCTCIARFSRVTILAVVAEENNVGDYLVLIAGKNLRWVKPGQCSPGAIT